jgi:hypothetical protein
MMLGCFISWKSEIHFECKQTLIVQPGKKVRLQTLLTAEIQTTELGFKPGFNKRGLTVLILFD